MNDTLMVALSMMTVGGIHWGFSKRPVGFCVMIGPYTACVLWFVYASSAWLLPRCGEVTAVLYAVFMALHYIAFMTTAIVMNAGCIRWY